jgi:agmatinase
VVREPTLAEASVSLTTRRCVHDLDAGGAGVVEVAPPYDHAEITGIAASHVAHDLVSLMALRHQAVAAVTPDTEGSRA